MVTIFSSTFTPHSIEDILGREERQTILGREKNHFGLGRGEDHFVLGREKDHFVLGRGEGHSLGRKDEQSILGRGEKRGREEEAVRHNKVEKQKKYYFFFKIDWLNSQRGDPADEVMMPLNLSLERVTAANKEVFSSSYLAFFYPSVPCCT